MAEDCCREIGGNHAAVPDFASVFIGAADHLAVRDSAAGDQHRHAVGPVRAAAGRR